MQTCVSNRVKASTRNQLNRVLNLMLLFAGAVLLGTGWLMDHRLPRGRGGHGLSLLGLGRHDWGEIHAWIGYGVCGLVVVHLALHSAWLQRIAARHRHWPLWLGFGTATALLVLFFFLPIRS